MVKTDLTQKTVQAKKYIYLLLNETVTKLLVICKTE